MCGIEFLFFLTFSPVYYSIFSVQLFVTDLSWTKLNLKICDILSTERIQGILKQYKLDHMKQLFKVFIEIIVIFWESSTGFGFW